MRRSRRGGRGGLLSTSCSSCSRATSNACGCGLGGPGTGRGGGGLVEISLHLDDLVRRVEAVAQPGLALQPLDLADQRVGRLATLWTPQCLQGGGVAGAVDS